MAIPHRLVPPSPPPPPPVTDFDPRDTDTEFISTPIDHFLAYPSAETEPTWHSNLVGIRPGVFVWHVEGFSVACWPDARVGLFYDRDCFIVLDSRQIGDQNTRRIVHDIYFWLGARTSTADAAVAAAKAVQLDEFLSGISIQHREFQAAPSDAFLELFPRIEVRRGRGPPGLRYAGGRLQQDAEQGTATAAAAVVEPRPLRLLRIWRTTTANSTLVLPLVEVEPVLASLNDDDVFVLDAGAKVWTWHGRHAGSLEKARAAQVVYDILLGRHVETEVVSQRDARSVEVLTLLGDIGSAAASVGVDGGVSLRLHAEQPVQGQFTLSNTRPRRLFRLCVGADGRREFVLVKEREPIRREDLRTENVFLLDAGNEIWVWEGFQANRADRRAWLRTAQAYIRFLARSDPQAWRTPMARVLEGWENHIFRRIIEG